MNLKSILSAVLAMFAVSVMASNNAAESTINQTWQVEDLSVFFNNDAADLEKYDGVVFDLRKQDSFSLYYKLKENGSWQKVAEGECTMTPTDEISGSIKVQDVEYNYMLENGKLTLSDGNKTFTLKAVAVDSNEENSSDSQTSGDSSDSQTSEESSDSQTSGE